MVKGTEVFFSDNNWEYLLTKVLGEEREKIEELILSLIEREFNNIRGSVFVRNIESADMLYVTVAHGDYHHYLHSQLNRNQGLSGYGLAKRRIIVINTKDDVPPHIKPYGAGIEPEDRIIVIPLIPRQSILFQPPKRWAVVVLYRVNDDFTEEDIKLAQALSVHYGYLLDIYYTTKLVLAQKEVEKLGKEMIFQAEQYKGPISPFLQEYFQKALKLMKNAEAGSLLIEVPGGFKYIAVAGYPENLLSMPPVSRSRHIAWYMYGEKNLRRGKPRILTEKTIRELLKQEVVVKPSKKTFLIKSTLGIPVVSGSRAVMFLNMDSFSSPVAFDDIDVEIAGRIGTYFSIAYEFLFGKLKIESLEATLNRINTLAELLSQEEDRHQEYHPLDILVDVILRGLEVLNTKITIIMGDNLDKAIIIGEADDDTLHRINSMKIIAKMNKFAMDVHGNDNILMVSFKATVGGEEKTLFIALVREDIWSRADIDYIYSIVGAAIIYLKNVNYLKAIRKTQEETLKMLGKSLEIRDIETQGHTVRTAYLTKELANLIGFEDIKGITWGAYLHDIGKLAIPDKILLKPERLTDEEYAIIKRHVIYGYDLIKNIEGLPETTKNVVLYHHERWDGKGYMKGLSGTDIPLEARIFAVIDVFDALISERPYKKPWPIDKALEEIKNEAGTHFDPTVVEAFLDLMQDHSRREKVEALL